MPPHRINYKKYHNDVMSLLNKEGITDALANLTTVKKELILAELSEYTNIERYFNNQDDIIDIDEEEQKQQQLMIVLPNFKFFLEKIDKLINCAAQCKRLAETTPKKLTSSEELKAFKEACENVNDALITLHESLLPANQKALLEAKKEKISNRAEYLPFIGWIAGAIIGFVIGAIIVALTLPTAPLLPFALSTALGGAMLGTVSSGFFTKEFRLEEEMLNTITNSASNEKDILPEFWVTLKTTARTSISTETFEELLKPSPQPT